MHLAKLTWRHALLPALALVVAVLFGLPSCADDARNNPASVLPAVNPASVDGMIGPEGGTVTHPSGAQIVIPAGALTAPTRITLVGIAAPAAGALGGTPLGQGFDAGPEGQTFLKPVDVVVPFDPTLLPTGVNATGARLLMAPHGSSDFVALQSTVDVAGRTIRASTVHFTQFVPAYQPNPVFITTPPVLPQATVGTAYAQQLAATGGAPPYTWSISAGAILPPGLALSGSGSFAGTPTVPTAYAFFVTAGDTANHAVQMALTLTVVPANNPVPVLTQVSPTSATQGSAAIAITLTGSGFVPPSQALWDGTPLATTFVGATQLAASIPASALVDAGTHQVSVSSPAPGGGTSASIPFTVTPATPNPVPTITSVSPTQLPVSSVDTQIAVVGTNFIPSSSVVIGSQGIPTIYTSPTQLSATIPVAYLATPGTLGISVFNPPPGGGLSATTVPVVVGTLNPVPTLATISPTSVTAGSTDFTLTLTGTGFVQGGLALFGSTALTTTLTSSTSATATVTTGLVAQAANVTVMFVNPAPGGGASGGVTFSVIEQDGGTDAAGTSDGGSDAAPICVTPPSPAPCGALGGSCCGGTTCNASLTCLSGVCAQGGSCGGAGQPCCPAGYCSSGSCSNTDQGFVCGGGSTNMPGGSCSVCLQGMACSPPNGPAGTCQVSGSVCARTGISIGICTAPTLPPPSCVLQAGCSPANTGVFPLPGGDCCDPQAVCVAAVGQPYNQCCRVEASPCTANSDCCSGVCGAGLRCASLPAGGACTSTAYCSSTPPPPPYSNLGTCNTCSQTCCAQGTWPGNGC